MGSDNTKYKLYKLNGSIELPENIQFENWIEKFIEFIEQNNGVAIVHYKEIGKSNKVK